MINYIIFNYMIFKNVFRGVYFVLSAIVLTSPTGSINVAYLFKCFLENDKGMYCILH